MISGKYVVLCGKEKCLCFLFPHIPCKFKLYVITFSKQHIIVIDGILTPLVFFSIPHICNEWMWQFNFISLTHAKYGVTNGGTICLFFF